VSTSDDLKEALHRLGTMSVQITITAGAHHYREGFSPHYVWEVIALRVPGACYPAFSQNDDLLIAVNSVIDMIEERRAAGRAFVEEHPELKALPKATIEYLFPGEDLS